MNTDPDALLFTKSKVTAAMLSYMSHVRMECRNGLEVKASVNQETGTAEREAGAGFVDALGGRRRITLGADKNYDTRGFVADALDMKMTLHVAQIDTHRSSAIYERTTRHHGYRIRLSKGKRIGECFC